MNANLQPQTLVIKDWLDSASRQLMNIGIPSARLDAEIILAFALNKNRTYLHAFDNDVIDKKSAIIADNYINLRLDRTPIAYIIGYKEFYGRKFIVSPKTLIPRPESEDIITILKQLLPTNYYLLDIGTGSGCLGITAKLELPNLNVTLTDISADALVIADKNAKKHSAKVSIIQTNLLSNYSIKTDIIIANLPYVDKTWDRSPETDFEPKVALFADSQGLSIIKKLITQAAKLLHVGGYLIIEADPNQHASLIQFANKLSFVVVDKLNYAIAFERKASD